MAACYDALHYFIMCLRTFSSEANRQSTRAMLLFAAALLAAGLYFAVEKYHAK